MLKKFPSIAHPNELAYAYDSQAWDTKAPIESKFRVFQTYGDGICQHSGDWSVQLEHLTDYLASLAVAMLDDPELTQECYFSICRFPADKDLAFAQSVVFKESDREWGKRRFYSLKERKVTRNPAKEHDKRYFTIDEWCDGSAKAIYRMLTPDYADGLQRYVYATAVYSYVMAQESGWMELPGVFLQWTKEADDARRLRDAYEACRDVCQAYQLRENANSHINNYRRSIESAKKTAEVA